MNNLYKVNQKRIKFAVEKYKQQNKHTEIIVNHIANKYIYSNKTHRRFFGKDIVLNSSNIWSTLAEYQDQYVSLILRNKLHEYTKNINAWSFWETVDQNYTIDSAFQNIDKVDEFMLLDLNHFNFVLRWESFECNLFTLKIYRSIV